MDKMTVLHVASPFSVSMPVPAERVDNDTSRRQAGAMPDHETTGIRADPPPHASDPFPSSRMGGADLSGIDRSPVTPTTFDAVMHRYREWDGTRGETELRAPAAFEEAPDVVPT